METEIFEQIQSCLSKHDDAVDKADRLEGLLIEAFKEIRRGQDYAADLDRRIKELERKVFDYDPY